MSSSIGTIPYSKLYLTGHERANLDEALTSGHLQGDGSFTHRSEYLLEQITGSCRALLTSSGSDALEMAALLADIGPGDEVIMPSFTFVSTANAVVLRGATPVFVDVRPDTLNLDEKAVEQAITKKTRAIMPVHYAGIGCAMSALQKICAEHGLTMIEDAAHGAGAWMDDKHLGAIGELGILSFHQTKNIAAGEGGALLINNERYIERAEVLREKGTNRRKFLRGDIDKYTWVDIGSSFLPGELMAAVLLAQLDHLTAINNMRVNVWNRYHSQLAKLAKPGFLTTPSVPNGARHNGHIYYLLLKDHGARESLRLHLKEHQIQATSHYEPLHEAPAAKKFARNSGDLEVTSDLAARVLRLPLYPHLTENEQNRVIAEIHAWAASQV